MLNLLSKVVIALGVVNAAYLNAASPFIWATAARQPALVASDQAASRLAPPGFDQAQGRGQ